MPRIHNIRERLYANLYDAIPILTMDEKYERLFGNRNVGTRHLTNMMIAGQLPYDSTFVIANMYTRTNLARPRPVLDDAKRKEVRDLFVDDNNGDAIGTLMRDLQWERSPLARALEEWAHTAIVTLVIGDKPMLELNFHDLMDGPALGPRQQSTAPIKKNADGEHDQLPWRKQIGRCIVVPVRQNMSVQVAGPAAPARALKKLATKAGILPEPLAWVHLEGLTTRDVY